MHCSWQPPAASRWLPGLPLACGGAHRLPYLSLGRERSQAFVHVLQALGEGRDLAQEDAAPACGKTRCRRVVDHGPGWHHLKGRWQRIKPQRAPALQLNMLATSPGVGRGRLAAAEEARHGGDARGRQRYPEVA